MDSLDIFIWLVNHNKVDINKAIQFLFKRIYNGQIDPYMGPYFTNTYLFYLYKDELDTTMLWPIGVPTALRHILPTILPVPFIVHLPNTYYPEIMPPESTVEWILSPKLPNYQ